MNIELNSFTIDIIFLLFCIFFAVIGYFKGFVKRAYDFIGTVLALIIAYFLTDPISQIFTLVPENELIQDHIFLPIINKIIVFILLFIILWIIKKILGLLLKPLLDKIVSFLSITDFINHLLGMFLSLIEALVVSYFALTLMLTPVINNGYQLISDTIIAKNVLKIVPEISEKVIEWSQQYSYIIDDSKNISTKESFQFLITSYQMGLISDDQMISLIENEMKSYLLENKITLDEKDKDSLIKLIERSQLDEQIKLKMKNRVSD